MKLDHYWRAIEMPRRYWPVQTVIPSTLRFTPSVDTKVAVSAKDQDALLVDLMKIDLREKRHVRILLASAPKDDAAMTVAVNIVKAALRRQPQLVNGVSFLNSACIDVHSPRLKDLTFAVIYNVTTDSMPSRISAVRDFLTLIEIPTIVVCGGTNPIDFAEKTLRIDIDYALYFRDTSHCAAANDAKVVTKVQTI
jgi:hypothetical protein